MTTKQLDRKMTLDFDTVCHDVEGVLDDVRGIMNERYFALALGNDAVRKLKEYPVAIRKRLYDAFNLVVVGDFKRGKSTLINALLGDNIAPTSVTPETVTINKISYAEEPKAEAVLKNGRRAKLDQAELKREEIEKLMKEFPAQIDFVDLKVNNDMLKDVSIIDTPGVGDLMKRFDEQVTDYLVNADALIYVISARSPLSLSEQSFLSSSVMPGSFSRVLLVVNMADTMDSQEDIEKIQAFIAEKVTAISPNIYIYPLSALDEYCRKKGLKRPNPAMAATLETQFYAFENSLQNDILLQKEIIKSSRGIALTSLLLENITARIKLLESTLQQNVQKLSLNENSYREQNDALMKSINEHKASLCNDIEDMKLEARDWMSEFLARVRAEINAIGSNASVSDLERHFQFYLLDMIRDGVQACVSFHQKDISDRVSAEMKAFAGEIVESRFGSIDASISSCINDVSWSSVDTFTSKFMVASELAGVNLLGPLVLLGQTIAGFIRQGVVSKKQDDFLAPIIQGFDMFSNDVMNKVNDTYEQLKNNAVNKLDELYQDQINASNEAIEQAKKITQNEEVKKEEIISYMDSLLINLSSMREVLKKFD